MQILSNFQYILDEASKKGIKRVSVSGDISFLENNGRRVYFRGKRLPFNNTVGPELSKNKTLTKEILSFYNINTPKGVLTSSFDIAKSALEKGILQFPLVVKPNDKALGENVHSLLESEPELRKFFENVHESNGEVLVENYYEGDDYRFLVLNYRVIAVARRQKPFVIGDGTKKLKELVDDLDASRERKVLRDEEFLRIIEKQVDGLDAVVDNGKKIILRGNCNFRTGGILTNVTEEVPDFYKKIAVKCAKALGLRFCGIDFLIDDFEKKDAYVVTEVNSVPGLDAHMVADYGQGLNVAEIILDEMFKEKDG